MKENNGWEGLHAFGPGQSKNVMDIYSCDKIFCLVISFFIFATAVCTKQSLAVVPLCVRENYNNIN
jgi:hypothetical protein